MGTHVDSYSSFCHSNIVVLVVIPKPAGFVEFDITEAWKSSDPNYGVLLLATNEDTLGRDTRFFSNAHSDSKQHPFINVLCDS